MASAAVKLAVVCMLVLSVEQLMLASADDIADAALLRLQELEEEVLAEELTLLDDGVGATVCSSNCWKCLVTCVTPCIRRLPTFGACFLECALITKKCFDKK